MGSNRKPFSRALTQHPAVEAESDDLKNDTTMIHAREFNAAVIFLIDEFNGRPCLNNGFSRPMPFLMDVRRRITSLARDLPDPVCPALFLASFCSR